MKWIVQHFYQNPRNNREETFTNKKEATEAALGMSDDSEHPGVSTIECEEAGAYGRRPWNKPRIDWSK